MSFDIRIQKAKVLEEKMREYFASKGINYALSGYEHLESSDNFMESIRRLDDGTSKRLRYFPDFIATNKKAWLIEAKYSQTIEKDAYDNYMDLDMIGYNMGIVFYKDDKLLFANITDLVLQTVTNAIIPVIDNIWIAPRQMPNYFEWKSKHPQSSGTTFGVVDFNKTNFTRLN